MAYKSVHIENNKLKKMIKHVLKQLLQMYFHIHVCFEKKVYILNKSFNLISIKKYCNHQVYILLGYLQDITNN